MARFAIGLEYDGTDYNGWQMQPHAPSVQAVINEALSRVADSRVACIGAGRTDTGVHASGQVAHFDTAAKRDGRSWLLGVNSHLPADVNVLWVRAVPAEFHARYSAVTRAYRYCVLNRPVRSALLRHRAWLVRPPLDLDAMRAAAGYLAGQHDFSAFRASACQSASPVRNLHSVSIERVDEQILIRCEANAFLHHMVRNIVGSLVIVGHRERPPEWIPELLAARDRTRSGITAPACGLCLTAVRYPAHFALPEGTGH